MLPFEITKLITEEMMNLTQELNNDIIKTNKLIGICNEIINSAVTELDEMETDEEIETKSCEETINILHTTFTLKILKRLLDNNINVSCVLYNKRLFLVYDNHIYNLSNIDEIYNENYFILNKEILENTNIIIIEPSILKEIFKNKDIMKYLDETINEYELDNIFHNQVNLLLTAKG